MKRAFDRIMVAAIEDYKQDTTELKPYAELDFQDGPTLKDRRINRSVSLVINPTLQTALYGEMH